MNNVMENILSRRSIRAYKDEQIKSEDLDQILKAAIYAPSGMNSQSWLFTVVQNKDKLIQLNDAVKKILKVTNYNPNLVINNQYKFYHNAPTLIIITNKRDYRNGMADSAAAIENILLSANSFKLGTCWINQLTLDNSDNPEVRILLSGIGIPDDHIVYGAVALGYAKMEGTAAPRKEGTINFIK